MNVTVLATGFMQPPRRSNGMRDIMVEILSRQPNADVRLYSYRQEKAIPSLAAELVASKEKIVGAGHSFGCYWWSQLAAAIESAGGEVWALFLADGVGRHGLGSPLVIPACVREVYSVRQETGKVIQGSEILIKDDTHTKIVEDRIIECHHPAVDDEEEFQAAVIASATIL